MVNVRSYLLPQVIKNILKEYDAQVTAALEEELPRGLVGWYTDPGKRQWLGGQDYAAFLEKSARLLFPDQEEPVARIAREEVEYALSRGIVNLIIKVADVSGILPVFSALWSSYYSDGKPVYKKTETGYLFAVSLEEAMPLPMTCYLKGFFQTVFNLISKKHNYQVNCSHTGHYQYEWSINKEVNRQ